MPKEPKPLVQYAALPYRMTEDGQPLIMLITSRETKRWIIPKGRPEKKLQPYEVAAREAFEEAGLVGKIAKKPSLAFRSEKRLKTGEMRDAVVEVYLLEVERELDDWQEKHQRERRWMSPSEAALLVDEPGLVQVFLKIAAPRS